MDPKTHHQLKRLRDRMKACSGILINCCALCTVVYDGIEAILTGKRSCASKHDLPQAVFTYSDDV